MASIRALSCARSSFSKDSSLRKKWKNLRDYFGAEYSKRPVRRSGDGAGDSTHVSKWLYYKQMLFLKDIVAPRRCKSSLDSIISTTDDTIDADDSNSQNQYTVPEHVPESDNKQFDIPASTSKCQPGPSPTPQARGIKRKSASSPSEHDQQKLLDLEEKNLELLTQRNENNDEHDDDLLFLKSLLPYIKRIPEEIKLSFRCGIQRVVEDFAYGGQHAPNHQINNNDMYQQQRPPPTVSPSFYSSASSSHSYQSYDSTLTRSLTTRSAPPKSNKGLVALGTAAVAGVAGYGLYKNVTFNTIKEEVGNTLQAVNPSVQAAGPPPSQPSVYSPGKDHALYLWIHLKPSANAKEVMKTAAKLQKMVDMVVDPTMKDEDDEILAGVGFGPNFYAQIAGKTSKNYTYPHRKGALGDMPSSGGDVFVHAKSNQISKLFELCHCFIKNLPKDSIENFEDIYSFVYQNGRDLSGFIDGTENRADEDGRREVAVDTETGGSYVITQKWIHNLDLISTEKQRTLESWVGREKGDSTELSRKTITSHVARMTGGNTFQQAKPFEIVRQSMPFGNISGEAGLFFIGYAKDPHNFEFMLERMVGAGGDGHHDDIMRLTKNVKGTYWYFPGEKELARFA